jgi:hypothetical protein
LDLANSSDCDLIALFATIFFILEFMTCYK